MAQPMKRQSPFTFTLYTATLVQCLADDLKADLDAGHVSGNRENWTAYELLMSAAAHIRGAANQLDQGE